MRYAIYACENTYGIDEDFEEEALEKGLEAGSEEYEDYICQAMDENTAWEIYQITKETEELDSELCDKFYNDREGFIKEYTDGICL